MEEQADDIRKLDGALGDKHLILSKGVHLVFDAVDFPLKQAIYFDTEDGRMVFAIPRDEKTYVGTTDTFYEGDPKDITITAEDRTYLLDAIHFMFPSLHLTESHIESGWAGVRPLIHEQGKGPSEISRKDNVLAIEESFVYYDPEPFVWMLSSNPEDEKHQTWEKLQVTTGLSDGINIEIGGKITKDTIIRGRKK